MKISPISNNGINSKKNNQSFKGVPDTLVKFWQMIDNGGRAAQFTVEDMCGTNFPRSYKGLMAGYKYTKKLNILAFAQEAIREFLTGPTMCIMPVVIINTAMKLAGKSSDTHISNIKNLSYLMKNTEFTTRENVDKDFITKVVEDALVQSTGKDKEVLSEDIASLSDSILKYKEAVGNKKYSKKDNADLLGKVESSFKDIVKRNKDSYADTDFSKVKYSVTKGGQPDSTKFKNYVNYMINYIDDFSKKFLKSDDSSIKNICESNINSFKKTLCGNRAITIASMIGITGFFMSFIPKIYTWASGNVNPNAKDVYAEAKKKNNRENSVIGGRA